MPPPARHQPAIHPRNSQSLSHTKSKRLTNSLVGGGHEGGSGSNEEGEEEEGTHLDSGVGFGCGLFALVDLLFHHGQRTVRRGPDGRKERSTIPTLSATRSLLQVTRADVSLLATDGWRTDMISLGWMTDGALENGGKEDDVSSCRLCFCVTS